MHSWNEREVNLLQLQVLTFKVYMRIDDRIESTMQCKIQYTVTIPLFLIYCREIFMFRYIV